MTERAQRTLPLIDPETLENLPALDDAGMLGLEAMAFVRLYIPHADYALYVSGSDGDTELYGLLTTPDTQRLGCFQLKALDRAREVLGIPIERDFAFVEGELREIAYDHFFSHLSDRYAP